MEEQKDSEQKETKKNSLWKAYGKMVVIVAAYTLITSIVIPLPIKEVWFILAFMFFGGVAIFGSIIAISHKVNSGNDGSNGKYAGSYEAYSRRRVLGYNEEAFEVRRDMNQNDILLALCSKFLGKDKDVLTKQMEYLKNELPQFVIVETELEYDGRQKISRILRDKTIVQRMFDHIGKNYCMDDIIFAINERECHRPFVVVGKHSAYNRNAFALEHLAKELKEKDWGYMSQTKLEMGIKIQVTTMLMKLSIMRGTLNEDNAMIYSLAREIGMYTARYNALKSEVTGGVKYNPYEWKDDEKEKEEKYGQKKQEKKSGGSSSNNRSGSGTTSSSSSSSSSSSGYTYRQPSITAELFAAYATLYLQPDCSDEAVREAWKEQIKKNHPDVVAHLGEGAVANATRMCQQINEAYRVICRERGM